MNMLTEAARLDKSEQVGYRWSHLDALEAEDLSSDEN